MDFFAIAWLIPLLPLLAFVAITLLAPFYRSRLISAWLAIGAMLIATLLAWGLLIQGVATLFAPGHSEHALLASTTAHATPQADEHGAAHFAGFGPAYSVSLPWTVAGESLVRFGYRIDAPVALMLAMVTLASFCIHLFSLGYMARDEYPPGHERQSRFFSFIALFTAAMLGMVMADNLLLFFVCWEIMGLCSYLLIGFWYFKPSAYHAARKAFITTRIGDVLMMLGLFYLYTEAGSLTLGSDDGQIFAPAFLERISTQTTWAGMSVATAIALLLFMGTVGKSAQFPLHVWLPDAMEGPTPVSALIHAATMVAAGVFLVARTYPIFLASPTALAVVALIGTFTALFAALIAVAQFDIKRILAYSTLSQLGFMVAALGVGGWVAALFHLLTHAFFKALLFLGAGSVIHGMEAAVGHDPERAQDIRNMGGLARWMRTTWLTYLIGAAALAGVPFFAGFFSKDEILLEAFRRGDALGWAVYLTLTLAAFLTAFYMTRQVVVVFHGSFRGFAPRPRDPRQEYSEAVPVESSDVPPALTPEVAAPALGVSATAAQATHHHGAHHTPHESPLSMTLPLIVLAVFALGAGLANLPDWGLPLPAHWLSDVLGQPAPPFSWTVAGIATLVALAGIVLGGLVYRNAFAQATDPDPLAARLPGLFRVLNAKFYVDEFYAATLGRLVRRLGRALAAFDRRVVDGAVTGIGLGQLLLAKINFIIDDLVLNQGADALANSTQYTGDGLRQTITGKIQDYGVLIFVGILLIALVYLYAF
ncbi:NADH-quinone oxidoreductase subunit L [Kallotenue papyrolyticum]|uniref:NADH-quinone oxidoreductase subunit L n=1 Tax=Kallotenue papyrolyticum TaxID=1325125 RepID=UPI0004786601|nr:NADH-quinone oxidoreductase subunit L [Kallotenue papyrolyticum]